MTRRLGGRRMTAGRRVDVRAGGRRGAFMALLRLALLALTLAGCGAPAPAPATRGRDAAMAALVVAQVPAQLRAAWAGYKQDFIQGDGRVIDPGRAGVTTSEGQSYALLRAVWMDDHATFDRVWAWTQHNLRVRGDALFGYLWGERPDRQWSILSTSSATDADEDIALALIFARYRWGMSLYMRQAAAILHDIWRREVADVRGQPYLTAGDWGPSWEKGDVAIDPSYFAPYAYRIFARVAPSHPWLRLVDTSYRVLNACTSSPLGERSSAGLPPNWCALTRASGAVAPIHTIKMTDAYGYDAFRVMWRIALDYEWNKEPRARTYLERSAFLRQQWQRKGVLLAVYGHDGTPLTTQEDLTVYGGDIADFVVADPAAARVIAARKLLPAFRRSAGAAYWGQQYSYYEQNWIWLGLALVDGQLSQLARG